MDNTYLTRLIQTNPELFKKEIFKYTDENILIFITQLFFTDKDIFDLLITYLGQSKKDYYILQMILRILRNNNMELFKYILLVNTPYILNYYIENDNDNIIFLLNNLFIYDILLINTIKFIYYQKNLGKFNIILNKTDNLKYYIKLIEEKLEKYNVDFKLTDVLPSTNENSENSENENSENESKNDNSENSENESENDNSENESENEQKDIFYYESHKKNKILKLEDLKNIFKKDNTIFVNGNNFILLNEEMCGNKYKNIFLIDNLISNTQFENKKIIDYYNLVIILDKEDYKIMFPLYIDNKINIMNYNNIYFIGLDKDDIDNFMEVIEDKYCNNNDIILTDMNNMGIENKKNGNINIIKIDNIKKLLEYFREYKKNKKV